MGGVPRSGGVMEADTMLVTSGAGQGFILRATGATLLGMGEGVLGMGEGVPGPPFRILDPSIQACPPSLILANRGNYE